MEDPEPDEVMESGSVLEVRAPERAPPPHPPQSACNESAAEAFQRLQDAALLDQWPTFNLVVEDFAIVQPTIVVPKVSSIPNLWSRTPGRFVDRVSEGRSVANRTFSYPYPYSQLGPDSLPPGRAKQMCDYIAALHREEARRQNALLTLHAEGGHPHDDGAGERLKELGAPVMCVASNSAALKHRVDLTFTIKEAMAKKEQRSRTMDVQRLQLWAITTAEPFLRARYPDLAQEIYGYNKRERVHDPVRGTRERPDLRKWPSSG